MRDDHIQDIWDEQEVLGLRSDVQERDETIAALRRELAGSREAVDRMHEAWRHDIRALAAARAEAGRYREGLEQIASNLCFCESLDAQERPCDICVARALLDGKTIHDAIAVHHPEILATPAADVAYAPDDEVREIGRRMMDIHRETFQKLADAGGEVGP